MTPLPGIRARLAGLPGALLAGLRLPALVALASMLLLAPLGFSRSAMATHPPLPALPEQHILLLYAYGYGGRGVELLSEGFFSALTDAGFPVANVHAEYLDLQRNRDLPGYRATIRDMLRKKYGRQRIDLIVTLQQPALEFLLAEGRDLAPAAPVITLQHRPLLDAEKGGRRIVGEINQFDIKGTLAHALELFPRTRRVLFAGGSSPADRAVADEAMRVAAGWPGKLTFETTVGETLDAILQRVATLPPDSIVVFTQYNVDSAGRVALAYEVERLIVHAANAPVFGFYDYNLKNGGIGGSVIPVAASGARAGRLALGILRGDALEAEGLLRVAENVPMFDWRQIERWGGDASRLPAQTVFVNRPPPAWTEYGGIVAAAVVFILAESALIAVLVINVRRRRRAEADLARGHERQRRLAEIVEEVAGVRDLGGLMKIIRHALRELTGADGATLILREKAHCFYVDEDAIGPLWKGQRFPLESCISGWAMLHAQTVTIEDIYADERIPHEAYR
ncbi:MAG TPA: hypothetical protein VFY24_03145, partial [Azospira sp.]|nr:hypothetical protein [Azospira sp.]